MISISANLWNRGGERALAHDISRFLDQHRQLTYSGTRRELIRSNHKSMRRP